MTEWNKFHVFHHITIRRAPSNFRDYDGCRCPGDMSFTTIPVACYLLWHLSLRWRHNGCDCVSNHQPHDCLLNGLFWHRSKKTLNLSVTGLCAGNSPETGEFPAQMASNAENVSIWWRHHMSHITPYAYRITVIKTILGRSQEVVNPLISFISAVRTHGNNALWNPLCIGCYHRLPFRSRGLRSWTSCCRVKTRKMWKGRTLSWDLFGRSAWCRLVSETISKTINTWRPRQNGRLFADDIFKLIFLYDWKVSELCIPIVQSMVHY